MSESTTGASHGENSMPVLTATGALAGDLPGDLPDDLKDLVFCYLRISSPELRAAALRAVRAMAKS